MYGMHCVNSWCSTPGLGNTGLLRFRRMWRPESISPPCTVDFLADQIIPLAVDESVGWLVQVSSKLFAVTTHMGNAKVVTRWSQALSQGCYKLVTTLYKIPRLSQDCHKVVTRLSNNG